MRGRSRGLWDCHECPASSAGPCVSVRRERRQAATRDSHTRRAPWHAFTPQAVFVVFPVVGRPPQHTGKPLTSTKAIASAPTLLSDSPDSFPPCG